jgi:hypothetical protein
MWEPQLMVTGGAAIPWPLTVKQKGQSEESRKSPDTVISLWGHNQSVELTP